MIINSNKKWMITLLIFILLFLSRLPYISNSPYEYNSWRQSDTESIARNFVEEEFNIFYPQLNYDGAKPNYVQLEFQITTFFIAILYKIFGYHYELARLVPIMFFMGSAYYVYLIAKKYYKLLAAWLAVIIYGILPLNIFYSRAIMPEAAALFFFAGGFYYFSRWIDEGGDISLNLLAAIFTALAISQKIPAVFVGIPMLAMAIVKYRGEIFTQGQLWLFAIISLVTPYLYFAWSSKIAEHNFVDGIAIEHIWPQVFTAIFTEKAASFFASYLPISFTWFGIIIFLLGLLTLNWKREYPIIIWALAMIFEIVTIVAVIRFNYYLVFITPLIALLGGKALAKIIRVKVNGWKAGVLLVSILLLAMTYNSTQQINTWYDERENLLKQAEIVKKLTDRDDLIVVGSLDPAVLNACDRKGWRANIDYYDYIPTGPQAELDYFISQGVKYFVPVGGFIYNDDGSYKRYLEENFEKIEAEPGFPIFKLQ